MFSRYEILNTYVVKCTISISQHLTFRTYYSSSLRVCVFNIWNFVPMCWKGRFRFLKIWHFQPITGQVYGFVFSKFDILLPCVQKGRFWFLKIWRFEPTTGPVNGFAFSKFDILYKYVLKETISSTQNLKFRTYNRSGPLVCVFKIWNFEHICS